MSTEPQRRRGAIRFSESLIPIESERAAPSELTLPIEPAAHGGELVSSEKPARRSRDTNSGGN
jgi:hypothetical protein